MFCYIMNDIKASCGYGILIRNRTCLPAGLANCVGSSVLVSTCDSGVACTSMYTIWYFDFEHYNTFIF